jgi:hypothetical protein
MPTPRIAQNKDNKRISENDQLKSDQVVNSTAGTVTVSGIKEDEAIKSWKASIPVKISREDKEGSVVSTLNINDILLGRGGHNNKYIGNERLRQMVAEQVQCYAMSTKLKKSKMVRAIVRHIRSFDPPGRFLRISDTDATYEDAGDKFASEKVSQVFRDAMAKYGLKNSVYVPKSNTFSKTITTKVDPIDLLLSTAEAMDHSQTKQRVGFQRSQYMQYSHINEMSQHLNSTQL